MFKKYQLRSYNFRLVVLVIVSTIFGIAIINSADSSFTLKQCFGFCMSLAVMVFISFVDYNWIMKFYWLGYIGCIGLLLAVELFGKTVNNAQRWLDLGPVQIQPSELSKVILIVFISKLISVYKEKLNTWKFLVALAALCAVPLLLILNQPSLSSTIVIVLILLTIIYCAGLSYKIIGIVIAVSIPVFLGMVLYISNPNQILLNDYQ
ncbi:MAG: FtsW/RodA/SpoVE family cell cycle protein, partial [Eubacteriales bacterium]|nr:FtsW/RodA/SpoVE family cell cycle protein [Eubacteriales bacterium]